MRDARGEVKKNAAREKGENVGRMGQLTSALGEPVTLLKGVTAWLPPFTNSMPQCLNQIAQLGLDVLHFHLLRRVGNVITRKDKTIHIPRAGGGNGLIHVIQRSLLVHQRLQRHDLRLPRVNLGAFHRFGWVKCHKSSVLGVVICVFIVPMFATCGFLSVIYRLRFLVFKHHFVFCEPLFAFTNSCLLFTDRSS
jgi:hypothetical protein